MKKIFYFFSVFVLLMNFGLHLLEEEVHPYHQELINTTNLQKTIVNKMESLL